MTDRIYPTKLVNPSTPLGYDGSDYRVPYIDKQSDGDHALRVSTVADRAPTDVSLSVNVSAASHGYTLRASYTVPSGKRALLQWIWVKVDIPSTGRTTDIRIVHNNRYLVHWMIQSTDTLHNSAGSWPAQMWLKTGDVIEVGTTTDDTTARNFRATVSILEFDA